MRLLKILSIFFVILFAVLLSVRLDLFKPSLSGKEGTSENISALPSERNTWMNIFQGGKKIGFSHTVFSKKEKGYHLEETIFMRINMLGTAQDMNLKTQGALNEDFTLSLMDFELRSGVFSFTAKGTVSDTVLSTTTEISGSSKTYDIKISNKPYLMAGITEAVSAAGAKAGDTLSFDIFDPATMSQETVAIRVISKENIMIMGKENAAAKLSLTFKGASQTAWIGTDGEVLKEEGLLGITLEKTSREDALFGVTVPGEDLTKAASVASNIVIENPLELTLLKIEISGIPEKALTEDFQLGIGRQTLEGNILTIQKESLQITELHSQESETAFLKPTPFIQSDHEKIRNLAESIVSEKDTPLEKAKKLMAWIHKNIEKRPALSVPDAVATLENRMGDCNENAALFAALARASGIPAKVEAGLVYLDGRFYYHAWNLLHVGKWITADAVFNQIPADVTHICFVSREQKDYMNLIGVIGKVGIRIRN